MHNAERFWISGSQQSTFAESSLLLKNGRLLPSMSPLLNLHPVLDEHNLLQIGGRREHSNSPYSRRHPLIILGSHPVASVSARPKPQLLGQLPADRLKVGPVFERTGVDYVGPVMVKSGPVRKPILVKAYICVLFVFP